MKYDLIDILFCDGFDEHVGKVCSVKVSVIVGSVDRDRILSAQLLFRILDVFEFLGNNYLKYIGKRFARASGFTLFILIDLVAKLLN